ncbi:hypothetical protein BDV26DRAFT_264314 [Aspergillus bertholletiae]|uniref:Uncharacterized protein n=1 Tax=Aspergillus bertholletiae TaxID=1226010 RepID=A0A5N7B577_9EURO|nr:hypothetical protein BDV26DRAFT_264314 [Aspergillus bertholletiae]
MLSVRPPLDEVTISTGTVGMTSCMWDRLCDCAILPARTWAYAENRAASVAARRCSRWVMYPCGRPRFPLSGYIHLLCEERVVAHCVQIGRRRSHLHFFCRHGSQEMGL